MTDGSTNGVGAARAGTRILAFKTEARQVTRTLGTGNAFGSAIGRRTDVTWQAGAGRVPAGVSALRERTARRWFTRVLGGRRNRI